MQEELNQIANLALFARVVQTGNISRCARDLGMERTTVSRRLGILERRLGVELLVRSPKSVTVTSAGQLCYERCEMLLDIAKDAELVATGGSAVVNPKPIVVGVPPDVLEHFLGKLIKHFEDENPSVTVQCHPLSLWTEKDQAQLDFAIAWDVPKAAGVNVREVAAVEQYVCAAPAYLDNFSTPVMPQDIRNHSCIIDRSHGKTPTWQFSQGEDLTSVQTKQRIAVRGLLEMNASAIAGLGLCQLPTYLCGPAIEEGRLVRVLSNFECGSKALLIVSPRHGSFKPRATTLRLHIENYFQSKVV